MSGLELLPKAKAVRPDVPIIIMIITAYGDPETKRQAFENGAEALLTKPIDSRRCAVRSTAAPRAPHSRSKFPEFVALHESLDGTFRTWRDVCYESAIRIEADIDKYCLLNFQNMRAVDILAPCSTPIETKPASSILGEWRDSR